MCTHAYTSDFSSLPDPIGKRCPYPAFYRRVAGAGTTAPVDLPIDRHGACLFHSVETDWKRANDLPGRFLQLVELLDTCGAERYYDFAEFVFVGARVTTKNGREDDRLRITRTTFRKQAYFTGARFVDAVEMEGVEFADGADFRGATFAGDLSVRDSSFNGFTASYGRFTRASFAHVEFNSYAFFSQSAFSGGAGEGFAVGFLDVGFRGLTDFSAATFELTGDTTAGFERVRFEQFADFTGARFNCHAVFRDVTFAAAAEFIDTSFKVVGSSARYRGAAVEFVAIVVTSTGSLVFQSSDAQTKLFEHDVEMSFREENLAGTVRFENVNLARFTPQSRERLMELARVGRVEIGAGCIKYRIQTEVRTVSVEPGNAPLIVELCQTFAHYFSATQGVSLGFEIVARDRDRISFFYFTDEDVPESEFLSRLAANERGMWNLLSPARSEQFRGGADGPLVPRESGSAAINTVDGLSALLGTFFRVGARIAMGRWKEADTRALLGAIRFNNEGAELRAERLHCTLVDRYTERTLIDWSHRQNELLPPIPTAAGREAERMAERARIGIVTALPKEAAAVRSMLDALGTVNRRSGARTRTYDVGTIPALGGGVHALIHLGLGDMGNNVAANRATALLEHFPNVQHVLMVGIAGGVPDPGRAEDHVRLGDIVVSDRHGIVQYDYVKLEPAEEVARHRPVPPAAQLLEAVHRIRTAAAEGVRPWVAEMGRGMHVPNARRPDEPTDRLFDSDGAQALLVHPDDPERQAGEPRVFYGPIASSNALLKDPRRRNALRDRYRVKAVEMEGSGIADATWDHGSGYLVIRGICDYCDPGKNDLWQEYAAVAAAAYMRALLVNLPDLAAPGGSRP